jgi:hypothetical protein
MTLPPILRSLAALASALALAPAFAAEPAGVSTPPAVSASLPPMQERGGIRYTTGGITDDESAAFRCERAFYPLAIEVLEHERGATRSQYTADAIVRIAAPDGRQVFEARAEGPFMLVRIGPGRYTVSATLDGRTLEKKNVVVGTGQGSKTAVASFVFPVAGNP